MSTPRGPGARQQRGPSAPGSVAPAPPMQRLPSAFRRADGRPRFVLSVPAAALRDPGVRLIALQETERGGYEYPTRAFIDAHLAAGDLFIDIGAHWGVYSLHAASRWPGERRVLAIEPHPDNVRQLLRLIGENGFAQAIEVVCCAAGADAGTAPLVFNSTMAHSLHGLGLPAGAPDLGRLTVPVLPLDLILAGQPAFAERSILLKIDVEGFEPEVIAGAERVLASGKVKSVIWEHGSAFVEGRRPEALAAMLATLARLGFRQFRFPHPTMGGPLLPFAGTPEVYNVFALAPGVEPLPLYDKAPRRPEPLPPLERPPANPDIRADVTRRLIAAQATDAARWADFADMVEGADERAAAAAPWIQPGSRVLDVGAGTMALRSLLPAGCRYTPADLLPWDAATRVCDLNQRQFPDGGFDVVVLIDVLEFVHDAAWLIGRARTAAPRLLLCYRPVHAGDDSGDEQARRRAAGFFNDLSGNAIEALCAAAGWCVGPHSANGDRVYWDLRSR